MPRPREPRQQNYIPVSEKTRHTKFGKILDQEGQTNIFFNMWMVLVVVLSTVH
jgi:hypothetical protein